MKLKKGDVFSIDLGDQTIGFGQIVVLPTKSTLLICVFELRIAIEEQITLKEICSSNILFLGYSFDAKLYHKDWKIIGNYVDNFCQLIN